MAINKVEANGQTLIDLTNDTAEAEDVLEGQTFHLRSGAIATGTYRPSDEIEARLEATVGHSSKNLLKITGNNQIAYGVEFVADATAGTITAYNESTSTSQNRSQYNFRGDSLELIEGSFLRDGLIYSCEGLVAYTACGIGYYNDSDTIISSQQLTDSAPSKVISIPYGATKFRFYLRKRKEAGSDAVIFAPMLRDGSISDDTFEPYVTPTDEKKQDKPVVLWEATTKSEMTAQVTFPTIEIENIGYFIVFVEVRSEMQLPPDVVTFIVYNGMFFDELSYYYNISTVLTFGIEEGIAVIDVGTTDAHVPKIIKIVGIPK